MTLLEAIKYLAENKYIVQHKGRYLLTAKFYSETIGEDLGIQVVDTPVVKEKETKQTKEDWIYRYQQFIINSGVPQSAFDNAGTSYRINTATKPGREAFRKAIESGVTEESIAAAIKIYYSESRQFRVKIEKFMVDEMWRSMAPTEQLNTQANVIRKPKLF